MNLINDDLYIIEIHTPAPTVVVRPLFGMGLDEVRLIALLGVLGFIGTWLL